MANREKELETLIKNTEKELERLRSNSQKQIAELISDAIESGSLDISGLVRDTVNDIQRDFLNRQFKLLEKELVRGLESQLLSSFLPSSALSELLTAPLDISQLFGGTAITNHSSRQKNTLISSFLQQAFRNF